MRGNLASQKVLTKCPESSCDLQYVAYEKNQSAQSATPGEIKVKTLVGWKRNEYVDFWAEQPLNSQNKSMYVIRLISDKTRSKVTVQTEENGYKMHIKATHHHDRRNCSQKTSGLDIYRCSTAELFAHLKGNMKPYCNNK